jgi:ABC-type oligopeptide transport system substrate-binding subunit
MISGGAFTAQANSSLTDVNISGLVNASGSQFEINNNSSLATITINSGINATYFHFNTNALSQASVDQILLNLDTAGYSSGSLFLNGGTSSSPTSGTSNANYLSLIGKSWSVNIN